MTNTTTTTRPDPAAVGCRAAVIMGMITASPQYPRLVDSAGRYTDCWATFTGYPTIARFDLDTDTPPLIVEALRVLCLKSAVYELSNGDEDAAELVVPAPVDEMVHAVLAQYTLCQEMTQQLGMRFVHMTDRERFGWRRGDYTDQCYRAAGWGEPPARYWIEAPEAARRLTVLNSRYTSIGFGKDGRRHAIDFGNERTLAAVG